MGCRLFWDQSGHSGVVSISSADDHTPDDHQNYILKLSAERNLKNRQLESADEWHRRHVTELILSARNELSQCPSEPTLLILGAGNCHDLDLKLLCANFSEVRLLDLDAAAVSLAVSNAVADSTECRGRLFVHAPVDVAWPLTRTVKDAHSESGVQVAQSAILSGATNESLSSQSDFFGELAGTELPRLVPRTDVVVSLCIMSQLIESLSLIVSPNTPDFPVGLHALRSGHLSRMLDRCLPGGTALLITDVVSSDTASELHTLSRSDLKPFLRRCFEQRNYFSGCHPDLVRKDLQNLTSDRGIPSQFRFHDPWIWSLGARRYAVYAVETRLALPATDSVEKGDHA